MSMTVCVPVWNGEAFVADTLESVRTQTLSDLVVLVSVDKSDDRSLAICHAFAERDPRFRVVAQSDRLGWIGNVNWLLRHVESEFASVLPHDDVISTVYLERLLTKLSNHPSAVLAYCDVQTFGLRRAVGVGPEATGDLFTRILDFLYQNRAAEAWRGVFRSEVLKKGNYLEEANGAAADQVWLLRLAILGDLVRVPEILYRKRLHRHSVVARARTEKSVPVDSHWADHCVSCHRIALAAGHWNDAQKQKIAAACFTRALAIPVESFPSLLATAIDYSQRLSGLVPPGSDLMTPSEFPEELNCHLRHWFWKAFVKRTVRMFLPAQGLRGLRWLRTRYGRNTSPFGLI